MENNPFLKGKSLNKTGLNEKRLNDANKKINELESRQNELVGLSSDNNQKQNIYGDRQGSLANALVSEYGSFNGYGVRGGKKTKRRFKKSKKSRKVKKSRKY